MKTFKTEQLRKIVKRNGFDLVDGDYGDVKDNKIACGCILTHLYCANHEVQPIDEYGDIDIPRIEKWADKVIGKTFSSTLVNSFDNNLSKEEIKQQYKKNLHKYALAGFDLGQRARKLL